MFLKFSYLILFLNIIVYVNCEFYSAVSQVRKITQYEQRLLNRIEELLKIKEVQIKKLHEDIQNEKSKPKDNLNLEQEDTLNPISVYHRFKRLSKFNKIAQILDDNYDPSVETAEDKELEGAIEALIRLRNTYHIPMSDLTAGIINSSVISNPYRSGEEIIYRSDPLDAQDCFRIAKLAFKPVEDYKSTVLFCQEALRLFDNGIITLDEDDEDLVKGQLHADILEYMAQALRKLNFHSEALIILDRMLEYYDGEYPSSAINRTEYEISAEKNDGKFRNPDFGYENFKPELVEKWDGWNSIFAYEALCRGERYLTEANYSKLHCFYMNPKNIDDPYYWLWKIKVEEAGKQPHIVTFHDIVSDDEIDQIKSFADNQFVRATVGSRTTEVSRSRVSQSAWAADSKGELFERLSRRVQAVTGLNILTAAESLQIGNYGLGGHYAPHLDHEEEKDHGLDNCFPSVKMGNRIATWMFYLSDVKLGGATIFSSAGITIWPRKGSAAFWYNLRSSGHSDPLTRHAGCPVLIGSKWFANKWIHNHHQEFRKKCAKEPHQFQVVEPGHH